MAHKNKGILRGVADSQVNGAPQEALHDMFENYYQKRRQIYVMNLVRGVFFGFGSVIGGTLVVALLLWVLSVLQYVPFLDGITEAVQHTLEQRQQ